MQRSLFIPVWIRTGRGMIMRKRFLLIALICALLCTGCAFAEQVRWYECGDYRYILREDGTAKITWYNNGNAEEMVIPAELDGKRVTSIGDNAFSNCHSFISITIPDSVVEIGKNPFPNCGYLKNIRVSPDSSALAVIDGVLFSKQDKRLVCYPNGLERNTYEIPKGIRVIGDSAFGSCENLIDITIPDSVTRIDNSAFGYCRGLTSVMLPEGITEIGDFAFYGCENLSSITLPDSVTEIGMNPIFRCDNLTDIRISPDSPAFAIADDVLFFKRDEKLVCRLPAFEKASYEIPMGVRTVGDGAFMGASSLISITIPDSVTEIGRDAFAGCVNLTSVAIPGSVTKIGYWAFLRCESLTSVTISDGLIEIDAEAFIGCECLTSITIPDSVTQIGDYAFDENTGITLIVGHDSYAAQYAEENGLNYMYPDSMDWLND